MTTEELRKNATQQLKSVFLTTLGKASDGINIDTIVKKCEEAIFFTTIRTLVQASDASFVKVYGSFFSNLYFNLTRYKHAAGLVGQIVSNPETTLNSIILDGPLEMNKELPEIQELKRQEEEDTKPKTCAPNVSGMKCPACTSTKINMRLVQTKGGDEGFTRFLTCCVCGETWKRG